MTDQKANQVESDEKQIERMANFMRYRRGDASGWVLMDLVRHCADVSILDIIRLNKIAARRAALD